MKNDDSNNIISWSTTSTNDATDYYIPTTPIYFSSDGGENWDTFDEEYPLSQFIKDMMSDKEKPWLIRVLDVYLHFQMIFYDWLEKKLKKR